MSAIKATQKLDMLGIGMQHQKDPNGIAWRQNRDFENLLRRLNEGTDDVTGPFHKAREESLKGWGEGGEEQTSTSETGNLQDVDEDERDGDEDEGEVVIAKKEKKKKKKKRKTAEALEEDEDPPDKKKRKKRKGVKGDDEHHALAKSEPPLAPCCPPPPPESPTMRKEEPGFASTAAVTAPVSIRAPYVAPHLTFRGFQIGRANRYIRPKRAFHFHSSLPTAAHARTAPASSQPNAWRRQIRLRSPRSSASRRLLPLLPFPPRTPPPPSLLPTRLPPSPPLKSKSL